MKFPSQLLEVSVCIWAGYEQTLCPLSLFIAKFHKYYFPLLLYNIERKIPSSLTTVKSNMLNCLVKCICIVKLKVWFHFSTCTFLQASATVAIPKEHHRFVIGKNGEKLQDLELKTATKIQIPRPEDPSNQIKITGTKEGIEKARHEILLISAEQVNYIFGFIIAEVILTTLDQIILFLREHCLGHAGVHSDLC